MNSSGQAYGQRAAIDLFNIDNSRITQGRRYEFHRGRIEEKRQNNVIKRRGKSVFCTPSPTISSVLTVKDYTLLVYGEDILLQTH